MDTKSLKFDIYPHDFKVPATIADIKKTHNEIIDAMLLIERITTLIEELTKGGINATSRF